MSGTAAGDPPNTRGNSVPVRIVKLLFALVSLIAALLNTRVIFFGLYTSQWLNLILTGILACALKQYRRSLDLFSFLCIWFILALLGMFMMPVVISVDVNRGPR